MSTDSHATSISSISESPSSPVIIFRPNTYTLCCAVRLGHALTVIRVLTTPHIDINQPNPSGSTALITAIVFGRGEIVKLLLTYPDIDLCAQDRQGYTSLHSAVRYNALDILNVLVQYFEPTTETGLMNIIEK